MDVVKQHIKVDDPLKHAKGTDKYEQELYLLKKVRELNSKSFKNRIKTGGSLVDFSRVMPSTNNNT